MPNITHGRLFIALMILLTFSFAMTGCKTSDLTTTLQAVVDTASVVIPLIGPAVGLPAATTDQIIKYLSVVNTSAAEASNILASSLTDAQKATAITKLFADAIAPQLPAGTPQAIVKAVSAVADAVAKFLLHFQTLKAPAPGVKASIVKITSADRAALAKIQSKAVANLVALRSVK